MVLNEELIYIYIYFFFFKFFSLFFMLQKKTKQNTKMFFLFHKFYFYIS